MKEQTPSHDVLSSRKQGKKLITNNLLEKELAPSITLHQLASTFLFIGATSFGGGVTAYIRRIIVDDRQWLTNEEFFSGFSLCQLLPGANVVGISLFIGHHLAGVRGALVATCSLLCPPAFLFFLLGYLYFSLGTFPSLEAALQGAGAVACGMMATMFLEAIDHVEGHLIDILIFVTTFLLVHIAHIHVPYVILMIAPIAIWWHRPRENS